MHLGRPQTIGAWRVGEVIVDPGPASCLPALLGGLDRSPPRALALTHIHLDHAGAAGSLCARYEHLEVWVHERGAPHLADPSRLLASAGRLYGDQMERLWGEVLPVPPERIRVLSGGEQLPEGLRVAYTPGHASHHVAYLHEPSGWAFAGDVAGVRIADGPTLAPTPPPDIDLAAWRSSIEIVAGWRPEVLAITHFGAHRDVEGQLERLRAYLDAAESDAAQLERGGLRRRLPCAGGRGYRGAPSRRPTSRRCRRGRATPACAATWSAPRRHGPERGRGEGKRAAGSEPLQDLALPGPAPPVLRPTAAVAAASCLAPS